MMRMVGRLGDRLLSLLVPGVHASASAQATCPYPWPTCVGTCWCNQCAGGYAQKCCLNNGGTTSCRPCREGC
jgi:hypothetical protein